MLGGKRCSGAEAKHEEEQREAPGDDKACRTKGNGGGQLSAAMGGARAGGQVRCVNLTRNEAACEQRPGRMT
ncbi:hypothetical protein FGB62_95g052 [Gracilaria domingensis]|nr:hypothetical protein FGB62_95g052 [Gracilaria domingensis]